MLRDNLSSLLYSVILDLAVKTKSKMKRTVLFSAPDLTTGECFRAEVSECECLGKVEETVTGFDCTKCPAVLELCTWYQLSLPSTGPFYCLVNCFLRLLLFVDLVNCPTFYFPHGLKETQLAEPRGQFRKEQKNINVFEHYCEACGKFTEECLYGGTTSF